MGRHFQHFLKQWQWKVEIDSVKVSQHSLNLVLLVTCEAPPSSNGHVDNTRVAGERVNGWERGSSKEVCLPVRVYLIHYLWCLVVTQTIISIHRWLFVRFLNLPLHFLFISKSDPRLRWSFFIVASQKRSFSLCCNLIVVLTRPEKVNQFPHCL